MSAYLWAWVGVAYLSGSIPFAYLLGRARGVDVRQIGSGNVGATNLGRALGRRWGILCFTLDLAKGAAPVVGAGFAAGAFGGAGPDAAPVAWLMLAVAVTAVIGHSFPIWLGFRGGKGVATGAGGLLAIWPALTFATFGAAAVWIAVFKLTRYVSLASILAAISLPAFAALLTALGEASWRERGPYLIVTTGLAVLVTARHTANIRRLIAGVEHRAGSAPSPSPPVPPAPRQPDDPIEASTRS